MAYDAGSAIAQYIISTKQAEQAEQIIKGIWQRIGQSQQPATNGTKTATAEEVKLAQALAKTAEAEARRAAATAKKAAEDAKANIRTAQQAVEEQKLAREVANTAAAEDRAAQAALRRSAAEQKASQQGKNGGLGPALPRTVDGLSGPALNAAKAFLTLQAAQKTLDFVKTGASAYDTAKAFDGLAISAKTTSATLLSSLRAAADGTIRDTDLIKSANLGLLLTNGKIAKDLPQIIEIARASAKATGQDINFIYDSLVRGIARGSPRIIDNAGITLDAAAAFNTYAKSIGKSADKLTSQEQQQATLNAVLAKGGEIIKTVGIDGNSASTNIDRATIAVKNLGDALAQKIAPFVGESAGGFANLLNLGSISPGTDSAGEGVQAKLVRDASGYDAYTAAVAKTNEQIKAEAGYFGYVTNGLNALTPAEFAYTQALIQRGVATGNAILNTRAHSGVLKELNDFISVSSAGNNQLRDSLLQQVPALADVASGTEAEKNKVFDLIASLADGTTKDYEFVVALGELTKAHDAAQQAAFQEERETRNLERSFADIVPAANAAASAIAGLAGAKLRDRSLDDRSGLNSGQLKSVEDAFANHLKTQDALEGANNQKRLALAKTSAQRIAELQRELNRETDPVKRIQLETQIIQERNSNAKKHTGELDKQLKLQESIFDSINKQKDAQLSLLELQIKDRQESRKEDRELRAAQRILNSQTASADLKARAQDRIDLINVNRQQRQQKIIEDSATANATIRNGKLYQSIPGSTGSPTAAASGTSAQSTQSTGSAPLAASGASSGAVMVNVIIDGKTAWSGMAPYAWTEMMQAVNSVKTTKGV
jgi:hypothetical protein